jgi:hypothetical protein
VRGKLTSNRITWYGYILKMSKENPRGFKHNSKRKTPNRKTKIATGTTK